MPKTVATSKEAAHFYHARYTTVEKSERLTRVGEVGELMDFDSKIALERLKPDKLVQADVHIPSVRRLIQSSTNLDKIIEAALAHPITMTGVLLECMEANDKALDEVAHLLLINRVFAAYNLDEDVTFATRWKRHVGGKASSKRDVMFNKVSSWWKSSP
uniref:AlNc14C60G4408 protein n=1 Tax=Albugo laibachii Nc14 TaxID=890382 RepID=F0WCM4_9STRA|nr:AlNc14C60G4408 [Albugo laibachii Nc14]|eukprot:CCA18945.1 AlNc14C60G4408 [Albugo laibachii Nc14]